MTDQKKFVVRGEIRQENAMGGFGSETQSQEFASLEEARAQAARIGELFNVGIYEVKGSNGADYPLVEKKAQK